MRIIKQYDMQSRLHILRVGDFAISDKRFRLPSTSELMVFERPKEVNIEERVPKRYRKMDRPAGFCQDFAVRF